MLVTRNIAMRVASLTLLTVFLRMPAWRPGRVQQVPFLRASFWRGLYLPVQTHALSSLGPCWSFGRVRSFGRSVLRMWVLRAGSLALVSWSSCVLNVT